MHHPTDKIAHTTAFVTPVVEHWLERDIAQCVHPMKDRSDDPAHGATSHYSYNTSIDTMEEGNVWFNNALRAFYLWLYGVGHMVKAHSDSKSGNPLQLISSKGSFICTIPQTGQYIPQPLLHQSWSTGWSDDRMDLKKTKHLHTFLPSCHFNEDN